jgi:competence transcription factor ComK
MIIKANNIIDTDWRFWTRSIAPNEVETKKLLLVARGAPKILTPKMTAISFPTRQSLLTFTAQDLW